MGACVSQKSNNPLKVRVTEPLKIPFPFVVPLNKVRQHTERNIFIYAEDSQIFQDNISQQRLRQQTKNIKVFPTEQSFREYTQDSKNNILILCLKEKNNYKKYIQHFHVYSRIALAYDFSILGCNQQNSRQKNISIIDKFKHQIRLTTNHGLIEIIQSTNQSFSEFIINLNQNQSIYLCNIDKALINRTFVTYDYFFCRNNQHHRQLFHDWLASEGPEGIAILENIKNIQQNQELENKIFPTIFGGGNNKYLEAIQLLGRCRNPIILPHISWFCNYLFTFIQKKYEDSKNKLQNNKVYVSVDLTKEQIKNINNSLKQNFMFSTFKIGSTINSRAIDKKIPSSQSKIQTYKFIINIPSKTELQKYHSDVDLGFYIDNDAAIFNILNLYRIDNINKQDRQIYVTYSSIGHEINFRKQDRNSKYYTLYNIRMMKLYDYYMFNRQNIFNQMDLIFALQMYDTYLNYIDDDLRKSNSIKYSNQNSQRFSAITSENFSQISSTLRTTYIPSKNFKQSIGDSFAALHRYKDAQDKYLLLNSKQTGFVKILSLCEKNNDQVKFKEVYEQLIKLPSFDVKYNNKFLQVVIDNFKSISLLRKGKYKEASKLIYDSINRLTSQFNQKYVEIKKFQKQAVQSFPLYYILLKTCALIDEKKGDTILAEQNLKQYELNWPNFQGIHIYLLP